MNTKAETDRLLARLDESSCTLVICPSVKPELAAGKVTAERMLKKVQEEESQKKESRRRRISWLRSFFTIISLGTFSLLFPSH